MGSGLAAGAVDANVAGGAIGIGAAFEAARLDRALAGHADLSDRAIGVGLALDGRRHDRAAAVDADRVRAAIGVGRAFEDRWLGEADPVLAEAVVAIGVGRALVARGLEAATVVASRARLAVGVGRARIDARAVGADRAGEAFTLAAARERGRGRAVWIVAAGVFGGATSRDEHGHESDGDDLGKDLEHERPREKGVEGWRAPRRSLPGLSQEMCRMCGSMILAT